MPNQQNWPIILVAQSLGEIVVGDVCRETHYLTPRCHKLFAGDSLFGFSLEYQARTSHHFRRYTRDRFPGDASSRKRRDYAAEIGRHHHTSSSGRECGVDPGR